MIGSINRAFYQSLSNRINRETRSIADSLSRITTGNRIVRPSDEPVLSGFIDRLDSQLRGMYQAAKNVNVARGYTSTADSALSSLSDIAIRLRELAQSASSSDISTDDRALVVKEANQLINEYNSIANNTTFDGRAILTGQVSNIQVQTGPNAGQNFSFSIGDARSSQLGGLAIYSGAQGSIAAIGTGSTTVLTLNGVSIGASSSDGYSSASASGSGLAVANAINEKSSETGVYAEALATTRTLYVDAALTGFSGTLAANQFKINGVAITGTSITSAALLVDAINDQTTTTGVNASLTSLGDIQLTAEDGRNIQIQLSARGAASGIYQWFNGSATNASNNLFSVPMAQLSAGSNATATGAIRIWSSENIVVGGGASISATIGIATGSRALVSGTRIGNINLSTAADAEQAIKILDSTIDGIATLRADIGAVHSRLDASAVYLLDSSVAVDDTKEALSATDYSLEIANLVSSQILQNAGVAALAQANVTRSVVARLLQEL